LPDNGTLSIKATRSTDGKVKEGKFDLGAVSEVRGKIAKACDWGDGSMDEPVWARLSTKKSVNWRNSHIGRTIAIGL
jgi:hypothetical protein